MSAPSNPNSSRDSAPSSTSSGGERSADGQPLAPEVPQVAQDEERVLERVLVSLRARALASHAEGRRDYDRELVLLRDQIAEARLEDAPPLIAQMERLQAVAARRSELPTGTLDARSPYFAHLRLRENGKMRDVCLGRTTYLDPENGVRVVDWRNAPVSRIYYRYGEGDPYEEAFGDREVEGEVLVRRDVTIANGRLVRIGTPDAIYVRAKDSAWRTLSARATRLAGGQGTAVVPDEYHARGVLGSGEGDVELGRRERFLPEIAALLDPRQFEAISRPAAGIVVIQGGAGSGKTTIGLHRIAYLAYQAPRRFTPDKVIVVVPSRALASYTSRVLPALDVPNVPVVTMAEWQHDARVRAFPVLSKAITEETPSAVVKVKKHPMLLTELERRVAALVQKCDTELREACAIAPPAISDAILAAWEALGASPIAGRLSGLRKYLAGTLHLPDVPPPPSPGVVRAPIDHRIAQLWRRARDIVSFWADLLTDRDTLFAMVGVKVPSGLAPLTRADVEETQRWCMRRCEAVVSAIPGFGDEAARPGTAPTGAPATAAERARVRERDRSKRKIEQLELDLGVGSGLEFEELGDERHREDPDREVEVRPSRPPRRIADTDEQRPAYRDDDEDQEAPDESLRFMPVDGRVDDEEALGAALDAEDDALFLRLHQRLRGPLHGRGKSALSYEHVFVDEVQDCAPIDLAVLVDTTHVVAGERSMTLAGDIAQRLSLETGLGEFAPALEALGLPHVEVEPLTIGYRSTRQVLELAREVLGPLAPPVPPIATRDGAPVELHRFADAGAAAAFLAAALRDLAQREPLAGVALIARHPWQADVYYDVLQTAEVPNLRRIRDQDFPFKPGIDLTDVRQVKGLEWDYVVLLDVNASSYPAEDESRHLLHIAATRAAHQLWLVSSGEPSAVVNGWGE